MTEKVKLKLTKRRRGIWETEYKGQYIDFYKLPSDGLWRTSYFPKTRLGQQTFYSMKSARLRVEKELTEFERWSKEQEAA
jgi:hypothetical protein